jgi:hypothetical protein
MQAAPGTTVRPWWRRAGGYPSLLFAVVVACALAAGGCGERGASGDDRGTGAGASEADTAEEGQRELTGYEKEWWERRVPITILLTGGHLGHLQPCGCTDPKTGGLERVASIFQLLRKRAEAGGGTIQAIGLGWSMRGDHEEQEQARADYLRGVYAEIGFAGVLLGATDLVVPAMCQPRGAEGAALPRPPVNVMVSPRNPAINTSPLLDLQMGDLQLRALTMIDPNEAARLEAEGFLQRTMSATGALAGLHEEREKVWVVGARPRDEATLSLIRQSLLPKGPAIIVDVAGQDRGTDRIDRHALVAGQTPLVVELSQFGSAVGVLDFEPNAGTGGWLVSYRRIDLVPQWAKYAGSTTRAVQRLEAVYRQMVQEEGYLERFPRSRGGAAAYVGSSACARCHPAIYNDWKKTPHARALRTLRDLGQDWDPSCVRCHVVGWERITGDEWVARESAFRTPVQSGYLGGVGCESCHGPGARHVAEPWSKAPFEPGGPNRARPGLRDTCVTCHDREQSFAFIRDYTRSFLPEIDHSRVPADRRTVMPLTSGNSSAKGASGR